MVHHQKGRGKRKSYLKLHIIIALASPAILNLKVIKGTKQA